MIEPTRQAAEDLLRDFGGFYTVDDVLELVDRGLMQSWVASDGTWMVTSIQVFPRRKVVQSVFTIGSIEGALEIQPRVVEFAKAEGADAVTAFGRPGWDRLCAKRPEWKKTRHFYVMELRDA